MQMAAMMEPKVDLDHGDLWMSHDLTQASGWRSTLGGGGSGGHFSETMIPKRARKTIGISLTGAQFTALHESPSYQSRSIEPSCPYPRMLIVL